MASEPLKKSYDFRQIAKAPDGSRLFWGVRERLPSVNIADGELVEPVEPSKQYPDLGSKDGPMEALRNPGGQTLRNERASFLVGHAVYGDAILATVGSTWASEGRCIYEPFTLRSFHRYDLSNAQSKQLHHYVQQCSILRASRIFFQLPTRFNNIKINNGNHL